MTHSCYFSWWEAQAGEIQILGKARRKLALSLTCCLGLLWSDEAVFKVGLRPRCVTAFRGSWLNAPLIHWNCGVSTGKSVMSRVRRSRSSSALSLVSRLLLTVWHLADRTSASQERAILIVVRKVYTQNVKPLKDKERTDRRLLSYS